MRRLVTYCLFGFVTILWAITGHAIEVSIDQFSIARDGNVFFTDTFNAPGGGPPAGPSNIAPNYNPAIYGTGRNTPLGYHVLDNTTVGSTSGTTLSTAGTGNVLPLDTASGAAVANAEGAVRHEIAVTLLTNVASVTAASALTSFNVLSETGLFDLTIPTGPLFSAYGIRFSDNLPNATPSHPDGQLLQLFVRYNDTALRAEIAYILQDFGANTITLLGSTPLLPALPAGADQIQFTLGQNTAGGSFFGRYEFFDDGVGLGVHALGSGNLFSDSSFQFVRGQFFVAEGVTAAIPEPEIYAMMMVGLGLLGWVGRRKKLKEAAAA